MGDGVEGGLHRRMTSACGLKLRERATNVVQCHIGVRLDLPRALELMQCAHRLRDRGGQIDEAARDAGIGLQGVEPAREGLSCRS